MYTKAAGLVAKRGYTNVMGYKDGIPGWIKSGNSVVSENALPKVKIPTVNAQKLNAMQDEVTIVDIRTKSLYEMGWIEGSIKIPLARLTEKAATIPSDKPLVVVDHAGKQVLVASRFLHTKGFTISRLQGGLMAWTKKGLSLTK